MCYRNSFQSTIYNNRYGLVEKGGPMKHIITFLTPCVREPGDYKLMVGTISMVVGVLRLIAAM